MKTLTPLRPLTVACVATALILSCLTVTAGSRPRFQLTDLGSQPGAVRAVIPYAVNDHGHVVGAGSNSRGLSRPFVFRDGMISDPGTAPGWGEAVAINNAGQIITHEFVDPQLRSFLIDGGTVIDLSAQAGQPIGASSLNQDGVIVGGRMRTGPDNACSLSNGVLTVLGTPPGTLTAGALDINNQGLIAGLITIPSPNLGLDSYRAVLFVNGQGTILGLPTGALGNAALAINNLGDVAGDAYYTAGGDGQVRAFLSVQGKLRDIGVLRGDVISNATDINDSRQVVGISQDLVGESRAFLYSGGQMYDLNDLVKRTSGWHFRAAFGINNRGQIVGEALVDGASRPFLLTPIRLEKD